MTSVGAEPGGGDLASRVAAAFPDAPVETSYGTTCVDVPAAGWVEALRRAREDLGATYFDWLSAVDEGADGFDVLACLWWPGSPDFVLLRTRVPRDAPTLPTATTVFAGARWHERETFEMFGIGFDGHEGLRPLLLPEGFEGTPLRKDFVLASRAAKAWPGAKEPGESDADVAPSTVPAAAGPSPEASSPGGAPTRRAGAGAGRAARRRTTAPGVPGPEWGPRPPAPPGTPAVGAPEGAPRDEAPGDPGTGDRA